MSVAMSLVLLVLCTLVADAARSSKGKPCFVRGELFQSGERTNDPCDRCWCGNGNELCNYKACWIDGVNVDRNKDKLKPDTEHNPDLITF